jgi:tRNA threonylcarbamoyladenosine biosynthesis protein TsaE
MHKQYISNSEEETKKIATQIFGELGGGSVVGLKGDLGAGKTLFVKGVMELLNPTIVLTSPTFVIRNDYNVDFKEVKKIIHIDLYRLDLVTKENDEFLEGVGDKDAITFIEWPERLSNVYKKKMVNITIDFSKNDSRIITV